MGLADEEVGEAEEVGEEREDVVVFLVAGGEAVAEEDALAGGGLVEAVELRFVLEINCIFAFYADNNNE